MKKIIVFMMFVSFCCLVSFDVFAGEGIEGEYLVNNSSEAPMTIEKIKDNRYQITGSDKGITWHGIGYFDGNMYWGVWFYEGKNGKIGGHGTHEAILNKDKSFTVQFSFAGKPFEKGNFIWFKQK